MNSEQPERLNLIVLKANVEHELVAIAESEMLLTVHLEAPAGGS